MNEPQGPGAAEAKRTGRKRRRIAWLAVALGVLVLVNVLGVAYAAMDNYTRTTPQFCSTCHNMESHVESYLTSNHMDRVHQLAGVGCKDCHSDYTLVDEAKSVVQYISGNYERVWSRRKIQDDMCLQCHVSMEYHANRTDYLSRNPHLSHWPDLRCNACHLSHDNQVDYCSRCHENGGQRMTEGEIIPRASNPWADPNRTRPTVQ